jgi:hypothetical protein
MSHLPIYRIDTNKLRLANGGVTGAVLSRLDRWAQKYDYATGFVHGQRDVAKDDACVLSTRPSAAKLSRLEDEPDWFLHLTARRRELVLCF